MKRRDIIQALRDAGLEFVEGSKHTHILRDGKKVSVLSRQGEIKEDVVRAIEKQTGVKLRGRT
ncbi:MAG: hypothetical protein JKP98_04615 [Rhodobacteraceae bacterium]|nr:hypothetical protein [Paracoccaceae bacterium]MBL4556723.1 hypothetical protein [Paracoccaceae bacterium]HBG98238.1 hypothetical protein [Paracoccaceae bacterium]